jgi:hypothetical protein
MFWGQDWSLSPKCSVLFTIYVSLLLVLSKHQTMDRLVKLLITNLEHGALSSEYYTDVL